MRLTVQIDQEEDGRYIGEVPELSVCLVYGETHAEAAANAQALALRILADAVERGDQRSISDLHFEAPSIATAPNTETCAAMREARRGGLPSVKDFPSLLAALHADD